MKDYKNMKFIRIISKKKKEIQNPWLDFEGEGPYVVLIYVIGKYSNNPEINNLRKEFTNKMQAITYASNKFKDLKLEYDKSFNISVEVWNNNRNLVKKFKQ